MKELLIQPLPGIGDMVWHLPVIHALAAANPTGHIDILTKRRSLADRLLAADTAVGEILWLERDKRHAGVGGLLRLAKELQHNNYQRVWILHGSVRYALTAWLAGIPQRYGYGFGGQTWFLDKSIRLSEELRKSHPIDKATALLTRAGVALPESEPELVLDAALVARLRQRYADLPAPWYALGIGSSEAAKQWGADKFTALAEQLLARGGSCLLIGGPDETEMATSIAARFSADEKRMIAITQSPIDEVAALLSLCTCYIGNDTGVLNLAAAVALPCIGLFGGSMPLRHSRYIHCLVPEADVGISREGTGMYQGGEKGMAAIGVDQVLQVLDEKQD